MTRGAGFSLVEVLVSLTIVAIGTLSMASLQIVSVRNLRDSSERLQAVHLGNAFLERLRSNSAPAALRAYAAGAARLGGGAAGGMPQPNCYGAAAPCTPAQLARFDLWLWEQLLDGATETVTQGGATTQVGGLLNPTACLLPPAEGAGAAGNYTLAIVYRGSVELPDARDIDCGRDATFADGSPLYGDDNEFRRVVTVQAFVMPQVPR